MGISVPNSSPVLADPNVAELLARSLRHEMGDFLQKVYASVAILQKRLPHDWILEQDVLNRLRACAETCKHQLDAIQDFLCPLQLACEQIDLADVAAKLVAAARKSHPHLELHAEAQAAGKVVADAARIGQVGGILLANACESARQRVLFSTLPHAETAEVEWTITDDGAGVSAECGDRLFTPFFTTRAGHAGLGLALARKIVLLHGGRISAANLAGCGFQVRVVLPAQASP